MTIAPPTSVIRVIDVESSGEGENQRVIEIGWQDLAGRADLAGGAIYDQIHREQGGSVIVNPGAPVTPETSAIHHLTNGDVAGGYAFGLAAAMVAAVAAGPAIRAFVAHSAKFERSLLPDGIMGGRDWICTYKCALRLYPDAPSYSNQGLRYWIGGGIVNAGIDRTFANQVHRAHPDAYVSAHIVREMLQSASVEQLVQWTAEPALLPKCMIGDWRGKRWPEVEESFLTWILSKDFDEDTRFTVKHELARRKTEYEAREAERRLAEQQAPKIAIERFGGADGLPEVRG